MNQDLCRFLLYKGRFIPLSPQVPFTCLVDIILKHRAFKVVVWQGRDKSIKHVTESSLIVQLQHAAERPDETVEEQALNMHLADNVCVFAEHRIEQVHAGYEQTLLPHRQYGLALLQHVAAYIVHGLAETPLQAADFGLVLAFL